MMIVILLMLVISFNQSQARSPTKTNHFQHLQPSSNSSRLQGEVTGVDKAGHFLLHVHATSNAVAVDVQNKQVLQDNFIGVHLVVLDERDGRLLKHRFYNIFAALWAEQLVDFLATIKDGRIVILATQGTWKEAMGESLLRRLILMGSHEVMSLVLWTQWVFVVEKGYSVLAEVRNLGGPIDLDIQVALKLDDDKSNTCGNLLANGHLEEFNFWQPDGCLMQQYSASYSKTCLRRAASIYERHSHVVFIGDSRMKNLYAAFLNVVDPKHVVKEGLEDRTYVDIQSQLLVEFFFNPFVDERMTSLFDSWRNRKVPPHLIVGGNSASIIDDFIRGDFSGRNGDLEYRWNLTRLGSAFDDISRKNSSVIWALHEPTMYERLNSTQKLLTAELFFLYNNAAIKALRPSRAHTWSNIRRIAEGNLVGSADGVHHGRMALLQEAQILMNFYCNKHMEWGEDTCCSQR